MRNLGGAGGGQREGLCSGCWGVGTELQVPTRQDPLGLGAAGPVGGGEAPPRRTLSTPPPPRCPPPPPPSDVHEGTWVPAAFSGASRSSALFASPGQRLFPVQRPGLQRRPRPGRPPGQGALRAFRLWLWPPAECAQREGAQVGEGRSQACRGVVVGTAEDIRLVAVTRVWAAGTGIVPAVPSGAVGRWQVAQENPREGLPRAHLCSLLSDLSPGRLKGVPLGSLARVSRARLATLAQRCG